MLFSKQAFCAALNQQQLSFSEVCRQLSEVHRESKRLAIALVIDKETQQAIYTQLPQLLPGLFNNDLDCIRVNAVGSIQVSQWMMGLSHFADCPWRDKLLEATSLLINKVKDLNAQAMGNALYSLRKFTDSEPVKALLRALRPHLANRSVRLNAQGISNALYGLQNMQDSPEVKAILVALRSHLANKSVQLDAQSIGNALYGLKNMHSSPEVKAILMALVPHIANKHLELNGQSIGNALYGLKNMEDSPEVKAVLTALVPHLANKRVKLETQNIGNVLYGLQNMQDSSEVKAILMALVPHINQQVKFSAQGIGNGLYGLQNMSDSSEVRAILTAFVPHLADQHVQLDAQAIANALYGLKNMQDSSEVKAILTAFIPHLTHEKMQLGAQDIGNALYGLQNMQDSPEVKAILIALAPHINEKIQLDIQAIINTLYGLQNLSQSNEAQHILSLLQARLADIDLTGEAKDKRLAEALYSLRLYINGNNKVAAINFIQTMARVFDFPTPAIENLTGPMLMAEILRIGHYLTRNEQKIALDLHLCSYSLAKSLCRYVLDTEEPIARPLIIIFGRSSHNLRNQGKMRQVVESTLAESALANASMVWEEGRVTIKPSSV